MTISYPDVSNYEGEMALEAGTVAVAAKASEGTTYTDPLYGHFKAEADRVGAVFFGYHYLHPGGGGAQADHCFAVTGPRVNMMIDHEPSGGVMPSIQDAVDFAVRYRELGGLCTLDYLPHWAWQELGSPSLAPLAAAGLSLVSSSYTAYSDTGPGWAPYGGLDPVIWQYTDAFAYSGQHVDFNAHRGTLDQLKALLGYIAAPIPAPTPAPSRHQETQMADFIAQVGNAPDGTSPGTWKLISGKYSHVATPDDVKAYEAVQVNGAPIQYIAITYAEHLINLAAYAPVAPVPVNATVTIDPAAFASALLAQAPAVAAAIAHALAVQEHNETPAS